MSPIVRHRLGGLAAASTAAAIILGAGMVLLTFPFWIVWLLFCAVSLLWLAARHTWAVPFAVGIILVGAGLQFGLPALMGQIANSLITP